MMKKWIFAVLVIAISIAVYVDLESNSPSSVKALAASDVANKFFKGQSGETRYKVYGEGKTVILIHSFNGYLETWNPNVGALVNAGYKVITYDLWGRGLSDRPRFEYDLGAFRRQLHDLVKMTGGEKVFLVGASFGSVIAADYVAHYPDQVSKVVFVGPAGWPSNNALEKALLGLPILPDIAFSLFGKKILTPIVTAYLHEPAKHVWAIEKWAEFASLPGYGRAALSTMRNAPVRDYIEGWTAFGKLNKPSVFIWGKQDVSFPYENASVAKKLIPGTRVIGIENAAHWVNVESPDAVNHSIIEFLAEI